MSLRFRLFLVLGTLVAVLIGAQGWLVRSLADALKMEVDVVALNVGTEVARALSEPSPHQEGGQAAPGERPKRAYAYSYSQTFGGKDSADAAGRPQQIREETLVIRLGEGDHKVLQLKGPGFSAEVPIPRFGLQEKLATFERRILLGSLLLFLVGLLAAAYVAHRVSVPLLRLTRAAVLVGDGALGLKVDEGAGAAELRQALVAFNRMSVRLAELSAQNQRLAQDRHLGEIGEVARGLAHSLRNPLHALGLSVDEIAARGQAGAPDEEADSLAAAARRQIRRLDRSIRSFLVFASQADIERKKVEVASLAEDVALEALQDQQKGIQIEVLAAPGPPLELEAVEPELRAMLQALVVNAVEASPPTGRVRIKVGREGAKIRIEVEDEGAGVEPEIRRRLFTPHVTTKASGSGMGLFLAQKLAASRYAGCIELDPRQGGGTCARLELSPRTQPNEQQPKEHS